MGGLFRLIEGFLRFCCDYRSMIKVADVQKAAASFAKESAQDRAEKGSLWHESPDYSSAKANGIGKQVSEALVILHTSFHKVQPLHLRAAESTPSMLSCTIFRTSVCNLLVCRWS